MLGKKANPNQVPSEWDYQYALDDDFKRQARLHQSKFRARVLKAGCQDYGNRLAGSDALQGKNFYLGFPQIFEAVRRDHPLRPAVRTSPLYFDMLRSEHIPYNFFVPLRLDPELAKWIFNHFFEGVIKTIRDIRIEYAPAPKECYLRDNTAFDAYVAYDHADGSAGGIGIEVKYTEREYAYGKTEKQQMLSPASPYNRVTGKSDLYKAEFVQALREPKFKQVWRNQLLGEAMLQRQEIQHFASVLLFPSGNHHFVEVCDMYVDGIKPAFRDHFKAITFEKFIEVAETHVDRSPDEFTRWLSYLKERYIVTSN